MTKELISEKTEYSVREKYAHRSLVIEAYSQDVSNQGELQDLKNQYSLKYKIPSPSNVELIKVYR